MNKSNLVVSKGLSAKITHLSFLFSFFVILIHAYNAKVFSLQDNINGFSGAIFWIQEFISHGISRVAVPSFFMLSGFLLFQNIDSLSTLFDKLKRRCTTLLVPYLVWNTLYLLISTLFSTHVQFSLLNVINQVVFFGSNYLFWFLFQLFIFFCLSPVLYFILQKKAIISFYLFILFIFIVLDFGRLYMFEDERPMFAPINLLMFSIGAYSSKIKGFLQIKAPRYLAKMCIAIFLISSLIGCIGFNNVNLGKGVVDIMTVIMVLSFWYATDIFDLPVRTGWYESQSFFTYASHILVVVAITKLGILFLGKSPLVSFAVYAVAPIITLGICCLVGEGIKKYIPSIYSELTGGRG